MNTIKRMLSALSILSFAAFGQLAYAEPANSVQKPLRVYADISGDLLHAGHISFFQKAKTFGDVLVIGVLSDEDISSYKRKPILGLDDRVSMVRACKEVDQVIVAPPLCPTKEWLLENQIDIVVHGDDFKPEDPLTQAQYGAAMELGIFRTVPYTKGISTTNIIDVIRSRDSQEL